jgi:transcriptional regulator with XRE-family HTH domain
MLNEALRLIRIFHDMKSADLASELGISKSYLSEIERGKKQPSVKLINKYSEVFEVKPSAIMFFSEEIENNSLKNKVKNKLRFKMLSFLQAVENASI